MLKIASLKMQNISKDLIPKIIPLRINLAVSTRYREINKVQDRIGINGFLKVFSNSYEIFVN